jgi:CheY-like chemotaxis protein
MSGHHVVVAADGPSGVATVLAEKPDLALVDIGLPGLDGYDVARAIRAALGEHVLLAAISGYGQPEDKRRAAEAGFDAHLTKPVEIGAVERLLGGAEEKGPRPDGDLATSRAA